MRDLVRARSSVVSVLTRCRQHVSSFLVRQRIACAGKPWTHKHRAWLGTLKFEYAAHRLLLTELLLALDQAQARRDRLTDHIRREDNPSPSPDGRHVAFVDRRGRPEGSIVILDLWNNGEVPQLAALSVVVAAGAAVFGLVFMKVSATHRLSA